MTKWPDGLAEVPPKPGVEVTETTLSVEEFETMRMAPKLLAWSKTEPRTSRNVVDLPGSRLKLFSGPLDPSWLLPRNFSVKEAAKAPVLATATFVV